jgi:metal-dependent hydrolase (beta-lactamase superfamily II)
MQYFHGAEPKQFVSGTPWENANFETIAKTTEILPGFFLMTTQSQKTGTMEMNELSPAFRTPRGLAVVVGCSHPGVEKILAGAAAVDHRLYTVTGGFHLVMEQRPRDRSSGFVTARQLEAGTGCARPLQRRIRLRGIPGALQRSV